MKGLETDVSWFSYVHGYITSDFANMSHLIKFIIYIILVNIFSI
jgi:hypothetical protein